MATAALPEQEATYEHGLLPSCLMKHLNQQRLAGKYCDLTLRVQDGTFRIHRCVLAAFSPYISQVDSSSHHPVIELPALTCRGVKPLVTFLYTSKLQLNTKNIFEVYTAAGYLHLQEVISDCVDFLKKAKELAKSLEGQEDAPEATSTSRGEDGADVSRRPASASVSASPHPSTVSSAGMNEVEVAPSVVKIEDFESSTSCEFAGLEEGRDTTVVVGSVETGLPNSTGARTARVGTVDQELSAWDIHQSSASQQTSLELQVEAESQNQRGTSNMELPHQYMVVSPDGHNTQVDMDGRGSMDSQFVPSTNMPVAVHPNPPNATTYSMADLSNPTYSYACESGFAANTGEGSGDLTAPSKGSDSVCLVCGRRFGRKWRLKVHMRTHTGEKPFHCSACPARFSVKCNLKTHVERMHLRNRPHKCHLCPNTFTEQWKLLRHVAECHS